MSSDANNPTHDVDQAPAPGVLDPGVGQAEGMPGLAEGRGPETLQPETLQGGELDHVIQAEPPPEPAPVEGISVEPAPVEPAAVELAPIEPAAVEPAAVELAPIEPAAVEPAPMESAPVESAPVEPAPVEPVAVEPAPIEPAPIEPVAVEAATAEKPEETQPVEAAGLPPQEPVPKSEKMDWYILKVQSNREESIREGLRRRIAIAGLDQFFGEIIVPTEKVTEFKAGKRRVFKRKVYPGYLVIQMEINEDTWFLVRETPGIGDFTGAAGHPTPMYDWEVASILAKQEEKADEAPKLKINFSVGDHVKIKEGTFENFEGDVASINEADGRVTVLINIFGRSTPVDIDYWQIEAV